MAAKETGFAPINGAQIYYETAGEGDPFLMIHAGVADSRQWDNEFAHFADHYRVIRYDLRGYGKSEPTEGEYSHYGDLLALVDYFKIDRPAVVMGCSMGGMLALDLALARPPVVKAVIMVGSGPSGLELDVPDPPQVAEIEDAYQAGDLERLAELETQVWFDGMGRTPLQVDQNLRKLTYEMIMIGLVNDAMKIGKRVAPDRVPAVKRLDEIKIPVLAVIGTNDIPFLQAAADYLVEHVPTARKAVIQNAGHLPNMEHPQEFQRIVTEFLDGVVS